MRISIFPIYINELRRYGCNLNSICYDVLYETEKSYCIRHFKSKVYIPKKQALILRDSNTIRIMKEVDKILDV